MDKATACWRAIQDCLLATTLRVGTSRGAFKCEYFPFCLYYTCSWVACSSEKTYVAAAGCHADVDGLYSQLKYMTTMYKFDNGVEMSSEAAAQLVSNTLYQKRFFPYYALPIVAGIAKDSLGYCATYDAVGSYIRSRDGYCVNGSAASVATPILDNLLGKIGVSSGVQDKPSFTAEEAVEIVKDVFVTVGERDILCGDSIEIITIMKDEANRFEKFMLKGD